MKVLFVGLSNKKDKEPFDKLTNSGKVVYEIIDKINCEYKLLNLVNYAPLNKDGKLRYPTKKEIKSSLPSFLESVKDYQPSMIICFGKMVYDELKMIDDVNKIIIYEKHPSYMYVYKRKDLSNYIEHIINYINN